MKSKKNFLRTASVILFAIGLLMTHWSEAQDRFSIEFRPGVNFPTKELSGTDLKTGFGFEAIVAYEFMTHFGVYAGWGWNRFESQHSFAGPDMTFEETGYTYGLQFMHALGESDMSLLARAGMLSNHIEIEDSNGDIIGDSGHGFKEGIGWQFEGRLSWPLGEKWALVPSMRYRSLPREIKIGATGTEVVLNYFSLGLGISRSF